MLAAMDVIGNPSSLHADGQAARRIVEAGRLDVANLAGCPPEGVILTSGATESNNLAATIPAACCLISAVEHDSVRAAASSPIILPVDSQGRVDTDALAEALSVAPRPALVMVMAVNNETGVTQPLGLIKELVVAAGGLLVVDAVQAAGRLPLAGMADVVTLSAHKLGGPPGVGAVCIQHSAGVALLPPGLRGGGQEFRRRAGTENILGIAGFAAAAIHAKAIEDGRDMSLALRDRFERKIRAAVPQAVVIGDGAARAAPISAMAMPDVSAQTQVMAFDLDGVSVGAGAACSSGRIERSHVMAAMNVPSSLAASTIRFSFGWSSVPTDADYAADSWVRLFARTRERRLQ